MGTNKSLLPLGALNVIKVYRWIQNTSTHPSLTKRFTVEWLFLIGGSFQLFKWLTLVWRSESYRVTVKTLQTFRVGLELNHHSNSFSPARMWGSILDSSVRWYWRTPRAPLLGAWSPETSDDFRFFALLALSGRSNWWLLQRTTNTIIKYIWIN